jgi:hypothetical protein
MFATEFEFTLPKGYLDPDGNLHRKGVMRLSTAIDEIAPLRDPRVKSNPGYATIIILARVINCLGALDEISPSIVENFFTQDLNYLQDFYRQINGWEEDNPVNKVVTVDTLNPPPVPAKKSTTRTK